jgi:hypothetical protein
MKQTNKQLYGALSVTLKISQSVVLIFKAIIVNLSWQNPKIFLIPEYIDCQSLR